MPADKASRERSGPAERARRPVVALFPWGDIFRDFLDRIGVSRQEFRATFTGSWIFGYIEALQCAGVDAVVVCPTSSVRTVEWFEHHPTGARVTLVPTARAFATLRSRSLEGRRASFREPGTLAGAAAAHTAPYFGTPIRTVARALREHGCSAMVCQEYETPRFDILAALGWSTRVPLFGTFQGGDYQLSRLERPLRPVSLRAATGIIVGASEEGERVRLRYGLPERKIHRIPNPVDTAVWSPTPRAAARARLGIAPETRVVAWHGQLQVWRKGLDTLLDAWRTIRGRRPELDVLLVLAGGGEDRAILVDMAADLPTVRLLADWVTDRSALLEVLSAADVYAFPSRHEGVPVAPLEAMSCGLPVVGADASGVRDAVGDSGIVVSRGDSAALADALLALLGDDERRIALGAAARGRAENSFSVEVVGARLRSALLHGG